MRKVMSLNQQNGGPMALIDNGYSFWRYGRNDPPGYHQENGRLIFRNGRFWVLFRVGQGPKWRALGSGYLTRWPAYEAMVRHWSRHAS